MIGLTLTFRQSQRHQVLKSRTLVSVTRKWFSLHLSSYLASSQQISRVFEMQTLFCFRVKQKRNEGFLIWFNILLNIGSHRTLLFALAWLFHTLHWLKPRKNHSFESRGWRQIHDKVQFTESVTYSFISHLFLKSEGNLSSSFRTAVYSRSEQSKELHENRSSRFSLSFDLQPRQSSFNNFLFNTKRPWIRVISFGIQSECLDNSDLIMSFEESNFSKWLFNFNVCITSLEFFNESSISK